MEKKKQIRTEEKDDRREGDKKEGGGKEGKKGELKVVQELV